MKCSFCGKETNSSSSTNDGDICVLCKFLLLGKAMNAEADFEYIIEGGITLRIKDGKVSMCWQDSGNTCVMKEHLIQYTPLLQPLDVIRFVRRMIKRKEILCSNCGKLISTSEISGSHFAGKYCSKCWEEYKKEHSGKCLRCNSPYWQCCC